MGVMNDLEEFFRLIGIFDIVVILLLIFINIKFWDKYWGCWVQIFVFLLYVFVFPIISMAVEIEIVSRKHDMIDGFNLLYTYFKFPVYWILYIIQRMIYHFKQ